MIPTAASEDPQLLGSFHGSWVPNLGESQSLLSFKSTGFHKECSLDAKGEGQGTPHPAFGPREGERRTERREVEGEEGNAEIATLALPAHLKITVFSPKSPPDAPQQIR